MAKAIDDTTSEPEIAPSTTLSTPLAQAGEEFLRASFIDGVAGVAGQGRVNEIVYVHLLDDLKETNALIAEMIRVYEADTLGRA